jgi:hypothetical protein
MFSLQEGCALSHSNTKQVAPAIAGETGPVQEAPQLNEPTVCDAVGP